MIIANQDAGATVARLVRLAKRLNLDANESNVGLYGRNFASVAVKSEGGGYEIEGVATTDGVDCDGEVVLPDGLDWAPLNSYKVLYGEHMYGNAHAVAVLRYVTRSTMPNGWRLRARMLPDWYSEDIPRFRVLASMAAVGMSIGFMALDRGSLTPDEQRKYPGALSIVRAGSVFECSMTTSPCNLACSGTRLMADDGKAAVLSDLAAKGVIPASMSPRRIVVMT